MKIIISHDVDHLYPSDHILRDLIFPKLWVRSFLEMCRFQISPITFFYRLASIFDDRLNRIPEITRFDKGKGVRSVFFFGMANVLGMSYRREKAKKWISYILENGFDAGVHGVEICDADSMKTEYNHFLEMSRLNNFGVRTHYVRYDNATFGKMADIGYLFDSSQFNKKHVDFISPYKVGDMWEFPLIIMDGYIMHHDLEDAKKSTIRTLVDAETKGIEYFTFLFHDYMYNEKTYPEEKKYYEWFVDYCISKGYSFISYRDAIKELDDADKRS